MRSVPLPEVMCLSTACARVFGVRYSATAERGGSLAEPYLVLLYNANIDFACIHFIQLKSINSVQVILLFFLYKHENMFVCAHSKNQL